MIYFVLVSAIWFSGTIACAKYIMEVPNYSWTMSNDDFVRELPMITLSWYWYYHLKRRDS